MPDSPLPHRLYVDREKCQSAATCLAFHFYELDDEVKAVLLTKNGLNSDDPQNPQVEPDGYVEISNLINPANLDLEDMRTIARESAEICPFQAIFLQDQNGNQIWPPTD